MRHLLRRPTWFLGLCLLASCATAPKSGSSEAISSHVYARPLDDVLEETTVVLVQKGWHVERFGNQLATNWRPDGSGSVSGYRVDGERIDAEHSSIRIESLAATTFASPGAGASARPTGNLGPTQPMYGGDSSGANAASGGKSTGWDGLDAPTTLGDPPPGMVTLPRGRDEALEWALLQRLDPRAAQAIQRAEARSHPAAATGPAAATAAPSAPSGCEAELPGVEGLLAERRLVLLADVPGTKEIPAFVGQLACQAARRGVATVVALELLRVDQDWVDTYFASSGSAADRLAFLRIARSFDTRNSGAQGSQAVLDLLDRVRALRDAGLSVRVVAFGEAANAPGRDKARASTLERARRVDPDALLLVVLDGQEARTVLGPGDSPASAPVGWYLSQWGLRPFALAVRSEGGEAWTCDPALGCQAVAVPSTLSALAAGPRPSVELYPTADAHGFVGDYTPGPLTASSAPKP